MPLHLSQASRIGRFDRRVWLGLALALPIVAGSLYVLHRSQSDVAPISGFTTSGARAERTVEARFLELPSAERVEAAHALLTKEPHIAGSPRDRVLAEWTRDQWQEFGLENVAITEHQVLLPYPQDVSIVMTAPTMYRATMKEEPIAGDEFSARDDVGLPYHAYSMSGDVTAPVVYAGSGNPADYDWLAEHGIDIKGRIALVRYSVPYSYRGFKALTAEQRGAAGILIYSDPADDGFKKGKVYPDGPWGPESHIQRGGIVYDFLVPGDPLTPGWSSIAGARRIAAADAVSLPRILSAPLSYKDARPILEALGGPEAPDAWKGGLPITYRVGAGPAVVQMRLRMDDEVRPIWTVTGEIRGASEPDRKIIVGNHRDAWIYGGVDPSSGSASLMELARTLGSIVKSGFRPKRTILFASWDAEEFTLTSSTEWGEQHEEELRRNAVAYLNVDSSTSGSKFSAAAVPSLNQLIKEVMVSVSDPATSKPLSVAQAPAPDTGGTREPSSTSTGPIDNRLGSGSDYTVFLNFLGIPVVDMTFTGPYGVYHSAYDNHHWVARIGDPGFKYHAAMTKIWGLMALRLANADLLPLDYHPYALAIGQFLDALERETTSPELKSLLTPARGATARLERAAADLARRTTRALALPATAEEMDRLNRALMQGERGFLDPAGIPGRPWYRHQIYAPKFTYAPEPLPAVAEALATGDAARVRQQVARLVAALERVPYSNQRELSAPGARLKRSSHGQRLSKNHVRHDDRGSDDRSAPRTRRGHRTSAHDVRREAPDVHQRAGRRGRGAIRGHEPYRHAHPARSLSARWP